jgi:hypothetical protein
MRVYERVPDISIPEQLHHVQNVPRAMILKGRPEVTERLEL